MSTTPNAYEISMDELRALAEGVALPPPEQPRDEQGRFTSAEPAEPPAAEPTADPTPEPDQFVAEREIDLGDGSGVQVFRAVGATEAEALSSLADVLVEAQTNATKKIQELAARPTPAPEPVADPQAEFLLDQQFIQSPTQAVREMLKKEFGLTPAEIRQKLARAEQIHQDNAEKEMGEQFIANNPDYYVTEINGRRIVRHMDLEGMAHTPENIQKAYETLRDEGLLALRPADPTPAAPQRRSSGLSSRGPVSAPAPAPVDTSKLTLDQLRDLAGGYQYR